MTKSAFESYRPVTGPDDLRPRPPRPSPSLLGRLTCGLAATYASIQPNCTHPTPPLVPVLHDGRLSVTIDMPLLAQRYRFLQIVGEGVSAQAIAAQDTWDPTDRVVVIKVMRRNFASAGIREAQVFSYLHARDVHDLSHTGRLLDTFRFQEHTCLVLEQYHGSLLDLMAESASLSRPVYQRFVHTIATQLLESVSFFHAVGVIHADLKPENALLTRDIPSLVATGDASLMELKMIDFGSAYGSHSVVVTRSGACEVQTLFYRAPEVLLGASYGAPIDMWSIGCMIAELALQRPLFPCYSAGELLQRMAETMGAAPSDDTVLSCFGGGASNASLAAAASTRVDLPQLQARFGTALTPRSPLFQELRAFDPLLAELVVFGLLRYDPSARFTADQALGHPYILQRGMATRGVTWNELQRRYVPRDVVRQGLSVRSLPHKPLRGGGSSGGGGGAGGRGRGGKMTPTLSTGGAVRANVTSVPMTNPPLAIPSSKAVPVATLMRNNDKPIKSLSEALWNVTPSSVAGGAGATAAGGMAGARNALGPAPPPPHAPASSRQVDASVSSMRGGTVAPGTVMRPEEEMDEVVVEKRMEDGGTRTGSPMPSSETPLRGKGRTRTAKMEEEEQEGEGEEEGRTGGKSGAKRPIVASPLAAGSPSKQARKGDTTPGGDKRRAREPAKPWWAT